MWDGWIKRAVIRRSQIRQMVKEKDSSLFTGKKRTRRISSFVNKLFWHNLFDWGDNLPRQSVSDSIGLLNGIIITSFLLSTPALTIEDAFPAPSLRFAYFVLLPLCSAEFALFLSSVLRQSGGMPLTVAKCRAICWDVQCIKSLKKGVLSCVSAVALVGRAITFRMLAPSSLQPFGCGKHKSCIQCL